MLDVTALILTDHETLRRQFAALDDARSNDALEAIWGGLARMLDVHAACEEEVFYPSLLKHGQDAEDETDDAIDDHNKIREGVREAARHPVGSEGWWKGVGTANVENSKHIAEEERDALSDFRKNAPDELREELAVAWLKWRFVHDSGQGVDTDKDPDEYIEQHS